MFQVCVHVLGLKGILINWIIESIFFVVDPIIIILRQKRSGSGKSIFFHSVDFSAFGSYGTGLYIYIFEHFQTFYGLLIDLSKKIFRLISSENHYVVTSPSLVKAGHTV